MIQQFVRYAIVGVFNTSLDFGMYTSLTRGFAFWRTHYLLANALVFIIVVTWSFFWNKYWAFNNREKRHAVQYIKFVVITFIGLGIAEGMLFVGVDWLGLHDLASKLMATPLVVLWNFSAYRFWAFKSIAIVNKSVM